MSFFSSMEEDEITTTGPRNPKTYKITASSISYSKFTASCSITVPPPALLFKPCTGSTTPTYILKDVSLTAYPSEILAIVGPSGAGKSTLLDILATRVSPTAGTLLLNSSPLSPSTYRKLSAYVPQHDACLPELTVFETFAFAARLLNPNKTKPEISGLVGSLMEELRLTHVANTRLAHGLSGGERRRVSIGLCLLHDPAVLLLDEPTSGLDSNSAFKVMQTLRSVTESRHRTVILSIHQPSYKILSTIDKILLLSKGRVVHHGTIPCLELFLLSKGFTVPQQLNPLEYAMEIVYDQHHNKPKYNCDQILAPPDDHHSLVPVSPDDSTTYINESKEVRLSYKSSRLHEIVILYQRFWRIIFRTKQLLLTNTIEALVVGLVLGTIYINIGSGKAGLEKRFGLFAFTLTFLLSSTTETLPIFINERPILLREISSGVYRLSSYLVANTLVFLPYLLAIAIAYSVTVYFLVGLCFTWQSFAYFVLVIWVIVLMANSFVLFLSSVTPNFIAGTSMVTILLAGFFLFSGYFISKDSIPKFWLVMHYLSMYKYALDALLINEYSCLASTCLMWFDETKKACMVTGRDVLEKRGLHETQRWTNIYILIAFFVFYRFLCLIVLMRRASSSKK
ncbi:OLC1v1027521C1 [Oldenlandia corymbosa var. corymbosa]|uniref:OLC1v1027521C1 n=1 Tax=Oldenlandia corymbosa var. corymbosa TaxID=529605 RepID=A0AAV1C9N7_OLDCO|nr:OLC1v1027521C1 [Oldenlandia corymbosa var. corymbosa]